MFGRLSSRKAVQRLSGSAGAKLIERRFYLARANPLTDTIPNGATRAVIRCYGGGGEAGSTNANNEYSSLNGGAGAFAKNAIACSAGASITIDVPDTMKSGVLGSDYNTARPSESFPTVVTYGGVIVCRAAGGKSGQLVYPQDGYGYRYVNNPYPREGDAADCIGSVKISGISGNPQAEPGPDLLILPGKLGVTNPINGNFALPPAWPGGGARAVNEPQGYWARGMAVIEYWSA